MNDMWQERDLPVLRAIVELCEERPWEQGVNAHAVAGRTDLDDAMVRRSLALLRRSQPPYIVGFNGGVIFAPTERGMRTVGAWPSAEAVVDRLVAALEQIAQSSDSEEKRSVAKRLLEALPGVGRDLLINALSNQVPSLFG